MNEITPEMELHSDLYARLDESASLVNVTENALDAAGEAGYFVDTPMETLGDVDSELDAAFDALDQIGPHDHMSSEAAHHIEGALSAMTRLDTQINHAGMDTFELPDHVDSGVYKTLGEWSSYVVESIRVMESKADEYAAVAHD